jgi:hypothetical protein
VINAIVFFVAVQISGDIITSNEPIMTITVFHVIGFTIFQGGILGAIFAWLMLKTKTPKKSWQIYATVLLVVSFALPFGGVQTTTMALWLNLLHLIAGIVIIPAVAKAMPAAK